MRNWDSCRCWRCTFCPCKVRNRFLVNFETAPFICEHPVLCIIYISVFSLALYFQKIVHLFLYHLYSVQNNRRYKTILALLYTCNWCMHIVPCISTELIWNFVVQVDYVVPVITENYLNAICGRGTLSESSMLCTDTQYQYIKYIYDLMATYYIRNGCINDKIRCVIPDDLVHLTRCQVMARPLFQVWVRASEVEQLSQRMLGCRFWDDGVKNIFTVWCPK